MEKATKIPMEKLKETKEFLANNALTILDHSNEMNEYSNISVEFGYIYLRNGEYETLFKVTIDQKTIYFAGQRGKLMRLQDVFTEELFQGTTQQMISIHGDWN